jgi:hypothetical protein
MILVVSLFNRWLGIRMDGIGAVFTSALAAYLIYGGQFYTPSSTGFALAMAVSFSDTILWWSESVPNYILCIP